MVDDDRKQNPDADPAAPSNTAQQYGYTRREAIGEAFKSGFRWGVGSAAVATVGVIGSNRWDKVAPKPPKNYSAMFRQLDLKNPICVLIVSVEGEQEKQAYRQNITHAARHNYAGKAYELYGDNNVIPPDNANIADLENFAQQFNDYFKEYKDKDKLRVHFVCNHHQNYFNDSELAAFFKSIDVPMQNKRAIIYACGPEVDPEKRNVYQDAGCSYVLIPRVNKNILPPERSSELGPGYRELMNVVRHIASPEAARIKMKRSCNDIMWDMAINKFWSKYETKTVPALDEPGAVITPKGISRASR